MENDADGPYTQLMEGIRKLKVMAAMEADEKRKSDLLDRIAELEAVGSNYLAEKAKRQEDENHG